MTDATADMDGDAPAGEGGADGEGKKRKGGKRLLVFALVPALAAGGGAFYAAWSGMLDGLLGRSGPEAASGDDGTHADGSEAGGEHGGGGADAGPGLDPSYTTLPPIAVSLGDGGSGRQLRMQAVIEADPALADALAAVQPRLQDTLLSYLRAVEPEALEDPLSLLRVRAQMLRRARMVAADAGLDADAVTDLLVTDFVLN